MEQKRWPLKHKVMLLLSVILLILIAAVVFWWDILLLTFAPQVVLTTAIKDAAAAVQPRIQASPISLLANVYHPEGLHNAEVALELTGDTTGTLHFDMQLQMDLGNNRICADGLLKSSQGTLNLAAYMDREFAAVTSNDLLPGGYYGICYDTFSSDLQHFPILIRLLPRDTVSKWVSGVSSLQTKMNRTIKIPVIPEISQEDFKLLLLGILAYPSKVSVQEITLNNEQLTCHRLTYTVTGSMVTDALQNYFGIRNAENGQITAAFYLYDQTLVKAELSGSAGEDHFFYTITLGKDPAVSPLSFGAAESIGGSKNNYSILITNSGAGSQSAETLCINDYVIRYQWDQERGDMILSLPGKEDIQLNLTANDGSILITSRDFADLLGLNPKTQCSGTVILKKGATITVPDYKNLNAWSFEDLFTLLGGIGTLFGLNLS